jgi:KUP system potassium uptake protein
LSESVDMGGSGAAVAGRERSPLGVLTLTALGIVFGDIGTSPLYAFREAFSGAHALPVSTAAVFGVLSFFFWALMLIVS